MRDACCGDQVKQIPLVAFDVGGIFEMLDYGVNADAIVHNPALDGLTAKLTGLLGLYSA